MYFGKSVIIPILFAILIGIVLRPVEKFLNQKLRIPRIIAILLTVVLFMCLISGLIAFTTYEFTHFMEDLPALKRNLQHHFSTIQSWIYRRVHVDYLTQQEYIDTATAQAKSNPGAIAQQTLNTLSAIFTTAVVFPVLLFLVLYYRVLFLNFILRLAGNERRMLAISIIGDTRSAMQQYIAGLFLEMMSVTLLQTTAMWLVGIKYFVFIGIITGILNMIPYIGILIAGSMGILIALATGADTQHVLLLVLGFSIVQFIDNNILLPNLVAHRVRINAFFSIVGVITGGLISGVAGMFLAIPLMAVMKVVFDNVPHLQPYGELMGDTLPRTIKWKNLHWPKVN
jgi:predicted PurR-regulated permease PerM